MNRHEQPPSVELHVEELVLRGFSMGDGGEIARFIEGELARLFAERGVPPSLRRGGDVPYLDAGAFDAAPGADAQAIGVQVAQALYGGFSR
jgi:hypothetical protein